MPLKAYTDYQQMLADPEIDAIDICTPHPYHAEQAIAAANAGKHLIIEKPIALSWEDAVRVRDAIRANGVKAMVCFEVRYSAQFTLTRSIVEQGLLGHLHYGEVDYYHGIGPWYGQYGWNIKKDMGASSLLTAGCHAMDILLMLMKAPVAEVTALGTTSTSEHFTPYEYPTTTVSLLKFADGRVGKVTSCIDCLQHFRNSFYHDQLNRHTAQSLLEQWGDQLQFSHDIPAVLPNGTQTQQPGNPPEQQLVAMLKAAGLVNFEIEKPIFLSVGITTRPDVYFHAPNNQCEGVCIYLDGMSKHLHGNAQTAAQDRQNRDALRNNDYEVIEIQYQELYDKTVMREHMKRIAKVVVGLKRAKEIYANDEWFTGEI